MIDRQLLAILAEPRGPVDMLPPEDVHVDVFPVAHLDPRIATIEGPFCRHTQCSPITSAYRLMRGSGGSSCSSRYVSQQLVRWGGYWRWLPARLLVKRIWIRRGQWWRATQPLLGRALS